MVKFEDYPGILTTKQAAELLQVHIRTLHRMIQSGATPVYRLPGEGKRREYRIKKADLLTALDRVESEELEAGTGERTRERPGPDDLMKFLEL